MSQILKDPDLLDDRLRLIYNDIQIHIINYHNLPFKLFETLRSPDRQAQLLKDGFTKTLQSKHLANADGKSEAMDIVLHIDNKPTWDKKYKHYYDFLGGMIISEFGAKLTWGGSWRTFQDLPHYQLK